MVEMRLGRAAGGTGGELVLGGGAGDGEGTSARRSRAWML